MAVEVARADVDAREGEARMRRAQRPPVGDGIDVEQMQGGDIAARATHMRRKGAAGACFRFFCCFSFFTPTDESSGCPVLHKPQNQHGVGLAIKTTKHGPCAK